MIGFKSNISRIATQHIGAPDIERSMEEDGEPLSDIAAAGGILAGDRKLLELLESRETGTRFTFEKISSNLRISDGNMASTSQKNQKALATIKPSACLYLSL